jgi:hypothetical protein
VHRLRDVEGDDTRDEDGEDESLEPEKHGGDRVQGAGSREEGAGSREQGGGRREEGAG